jgi:uncharacterized SAM-binding protein YcdF (DUF218 family)
VQPLFPHTAAMHCPQRRDSIPSRRLFTRFNNSCPQVAAMPDSADDKRRKHSSRSNAVQKIPSAAAASSAGRAVSSAPRQKQGTRPAADGNTSGAGGRVRHISRRQRTLHAVKTFLAVAGAAAILLCVLGAGGLLWIAGNATTEYPPRKADVMVVLGGGLHRAMFAADLYNRGYAPVVYVSRTRPRREAGVMKQHGYRMPDEPEMYVRILTDKGVPMRDIRMYGYDLISTVGEAEALAGILGDRKLTVLVVTAPVHAPRAGMVFRHALPRCSILTAGSPYDPFPQRWWNDQDAARNLLLEGIKTLFYLAGGAFRTGGLQ